MNSFDSRYLGAPGDVPGPSDSHPYTATSQPVAPHDATAAGGYPVAPWPPASAAPRAPRRRAAAVVAALAVTLAGGVGGAATILTLDRSRATTGTAASPGTSVRTVVNTTTTTVADVVAAVDAQVVSLSVTGRGAADEGSGVVIRSDGLILTNNHVISAAADGGTVTVTFTDGRTAAATIVAADAAEDLALVRASGVSGLAVATFGDSDALQIGDTVIAIGNELGLANSVSAGIVSALHRQVTVAVVDTARSSASTTYGDAIQTDAAINQGDSGGALFNSAGQVVGITSAIATASDSGSGSVGIGFAIASNDVTTFIGLALRG